MKKQRALLAAITIAVLSIPVGAGSAMAGGDHGRGDWGGHHGGWGDDTPTITQIATGLQGTIGGAIGEDGALYVPESALGQITRVDPDTGETSVFASGLPFTAQGGGVIDVAFDGHRTYALVSQVGEDVGGTAIDGIYKLKRDGTWKVIADLGAFSAANPPSTVFDFANGLQYALEVFRGGFVVTDGNHNRVLRVDRDGEISILAAFENVVPTGLAIDDREVYVAQAGPAPHDPSTGLVVSLEVRRHSTDVETVASGVGYLVDVELGKRDRVYALSIGDPTETDVAVPNTGQIVRATRDGEFATVVEGLNFPTSIHFVHDGSILVVTLTGDVLRVDF
jgi:sugar lactone lactonase YvrE